MTTTATAAPVARRSPRGAAGPGRATTTVLTSPAPVLAGCLLGTAVLLTDAATGRGQLGIVGVAVLSLALAVTLRQALRAGVGRPWPRSRLAARAGTVATLFVAAFLSSVGVLERLGPEVTDSLAFASGVAVMSVLLLVVLPLALVVFAWCAWQDRRLGTGVRALPCAVLLVVVLAAVAVAVTSGSRELWLQAAAGAVVGAVLTGFSTGVSRAGRSSRI